MNTGASLRNWDTRDVTDRPIFFTHIPKTAGTSLHKSVFAPNYRASDMRSPRGVRSLLADRSSFRYMHGHIPYGYHRFFSTPRQPLYFVVLRDPIERAISHYYNILHPRGDKEVPDHPDFEVAKARDLVEFYQLPRFQNVQTRIVAGIAANYVGKFFSLNRVGKIVLRLAKRNLRTAYAGVGVTEQFEETKRRFASRIGGATRTLNERPKIVPDRPTADDLSVSQRDALRHLNRLDVELYDYACKLFERGRN